MKNLGQMMKQAAQMQARMEDMHVELEAFEAEGTAGQGLVTVRLSGTFDLRAVSLDPSVIDSDDPDTLESLIIAAYTDAKTKVDTVKAEKKAEMTTGLPLPPGFKLPF